MTATTERIDPPETRPVIISPDTLRGGGDRSDRTPPGQTLTKKWPVLQYGAIPRISRDEWSLRVDGLCENPYTLRWDDLLALPQMDVRCDIHCVTHWSRLDNTFTGVSTRTLVELARPTSDVRYVMQHSASDPNGDWTTNVAIDEFCADDCMLTYMHDGEPLSAEHGAPVRAVVPSLYFWKGAKWITGIELRATDAPGFWEVNGYHMHGDPWREERFGW